MSGQLIPHSPLFCLRLPFCQNDDDVDDDDDDDDDDYHSLPIVI